MDSSSRSAGIHTTEVVIVGTGMVGLPLACALAGAGVEVIVIDRAAPAGVTDAGADGRVSFIALGSRHVGALEGDPCLRSSHMSDALR